ncbi:MAG: hypothetical protein LKJ69_01385 [Lactobacillus sp.]|jgi:hypothetical protein|nr:hypothetical protein [Lactobacillus sp.]MCI2032036.1 hypothetical protein [Lactobacillus sp.]
MDTETQALFDLIDAAYAEDFANDLNTQYHTILAQSAKALMAKEPLAKTRCALYLSLNALPYFRPMTLPPAGRALYGALHNHYRDYDAKQLRHQALAYGLIVAGGTWL